jgi:hypothetical protein
MQGQQAGLQQLEQAELAVVVVVEVVVMVVGSSWPQSLWLRLS